MNTLDALIKQLSRLPGIGPKSASRLAYYLLKTDRNFTDTLSKLIKQVKDTIKNCSVCGTYTEQDPCAICSNPRRDKSTICIVENPQDVQTIEATGEYRGVYHVLMGVISPINGVGPENIRIESLAERVRKDGAEEIILAMNPTVEGDTTALYISDRLKNENIRITRMASGLPFGGDLEYVDSLTLRRSLQGRVPYNE